MLTGQVGDPLPYAGWTSLRAPVFQNCCQPPEQQLVLLSCFSVFYKLKYFPQLFWRHIVDIKRDPNLYFQWVFNIRKVGQLCLLDGLVSYVKFSWQYFHCLEQSGQLCEETAFSL